MELKSTQKVYKIDWNKVKEWRTDNELKLPVLSMISFYKAIGIFERVELEQKPISPIEHFTANVNTLEKIKTLIKHNWQYYNVQLKKSNDIVWKMDKGHTERRHPLTLSKTVEASLIYDFGSFCPALDPSLEDDIIIFDSAEPESITLEQKKED